MEQAPPPAPEGAPVRESLRERRIRIESAKSTGRTGKTGKNSKLLLIAAGVVCVVVVVFVVLQMTSRATLTIDVDRPVARSGGQTVVVKHAVKSGDRFDLHVKSNTGVVLGDAVDPMQGMKLFGDMTWEHAVVPADGGRLKSIVAVRLASAGGDLPGMPALVTGLLGGDAPLRFELDREPSGAPVAGSGRVAAGAESRRMPLEYLLSGLTDLSTNYLPPREVHLGEVWDLKDCAKLGEIVEAIRLLATLRLSPAGFPPGTVEGTVGAEALETKDGEPCVRLKLALMVRIEGEVHVLSKPGWISAVAAVEGSAWTSTEKGVLWALETRSRVKSTYDDGKGGVADERRAKQTVVASTK
jgi:hypothetical protein